MSKLIIFDTTLRDGEQSPGVTLTPSEKVEIAKQLSLLGVDICEAGFPIASQGDFEAVERIALEVGPLTINRKEPMVICALARAVNGDILKAYEAIKTAPRRRIHTFLATSDIHLTFKLKISREECVRRAVEAVTYARTLVEDVEFSCEDAARSEKSFLVQVLDAVVEAGATTLNIPDTVGYNTPEEYGELIKYLVENVKSKEVIFSTHCHNDLGLATANTLSGVKNGARQVEVTINGIGERAGNTALEEVVMAIHTHPNYYPVEHSIDTYQIYNASSLVTRKTGMLIQPNKAIVGSNAFAHESGIHQDGMLKNKSTYEIIEPEILGLPSKELHLGKHSGRSAFKSHMVKLVKETIYHSVLTDDLMEILFAAFKKLADAKKQGVTDQDLFGILDESLNLQTNALFKFEFLSVFTASDILATATISIYIEEKGQVVTDAATGQGPVDAIFNVINRILNNESILASFEVNAVSEGSDSPGQVIVRLKSGSEQSNRRVKLVGEESKEIVVGQGFDENILVAAAKAYINALCRKGVHERRYGDRRVDV